MNGVRRNVGHDFLFVQTAQAADSQAVEFRARVVCKGLQLLVWLPQENDEVGVTGELLHALSAFGPNVVDLLPEMSKKSFRLKNFS